MGLGLTALNKAAGSPLLDTLRMRTPLQRGVFHAGRTGYRALGAATRTFTAVRRRPGPERPRTAAPPARFDLTPTDEQRMIRDLSREFAAKQLRPAATVADAACGAPDELLKHASADLGIGGLNVPESLGGAANERSAVTGVLVSEALANGDMGLALACLAPSAVSTALVLWGNEVHQATYLPAFVGENPPAAALAILEPGPLFDPFALLTSARRTVDGYLLDGVKSLVPGAAAAELFVIAANLDGGRHCSSSSRAREGSPWLPSRRWGCARRRWRGSSSPAWHCPPAHCSATRPTMPTAFGCPAWAGVRWRSAPRRPFSTTSSPM
jgi:hypothetical protein